MLGHRGFTIIELLIALTIFGVIAGALTRLIISQTRFFSQQDAIREARSTSRAALNMILSDLRMVEVIGGIEAAGPQSITVRVPYAFGIVCSSGAGATVASLLPSATTATTQFSGYAWSSAGGAYTYVEVGASVGPGNSALCTGQSITTLPGGQVMALAPDAPGAQTGTPVFLFQRIQYSFAASGALPGQTGLWRTILATSETEELVAPFQSTAAFHFYVLNEPTAQSAVPAQLSDIRGLELVLNSASASPPAGRDTTQKFKLTAAVFFKNRMN